MKIFSFFTKKVLIFTGLLVLAGVVVFFRLNKGSEKQMATVARADIVSEVASTGKIKPNQSVELGFDKSGRVSRVYVSVGDSVKKGQVLATLEAGELSADLSKARAALQEANIKLRETKSMDPISYSDASKSLEAAIRAGFADADDAVRNQADQFFKNIPNNPQFEVSIASGNFIHFFNVPSETAISINADRRKVETILNDWQRRLPAMNQSNVVSESEKAISDLNAISAFLDKMAGAVNSFSTSEYSYENTVNNYKAAIAAGRTEVSKAVSAVVAAKDKLNAAPTPGEGGQFESVLAQEAKVRQAEADVSSLEAAMAKSAIVAPFDGVVTVEDAKAGEAVSGGSSLISVISGNSMYIEANISEINIGKISVGNPVSVTFDAFPGEEFSGEVSYIEPGDVMIDGVVNYKIRVALKNTDSKIKTGLTSNLNIETSKKENVLAIPIYAVVKDNGQDFVNKLSGKEVDKVPVTLGSLGNNGQVEVVSGLSEGDIIEF